ncbi:MAG: Protein kinase [Myxococcales bacterium]|nr:Protein kinase [Myxococcales bacterium]
MAPGDKLGKYDLIRQIAVGGMAELYLARTLGIEGFEKLVVVKRILPQNVTNANFVEMFLNEARLAATLHHPNIAQVYDIGVEDGDYFFAMEYVHGEDLERISASSHEQGVPLSFDVALTLIAGLCAGLHYAHEKLGPDGKPLQVVHRDVSPSNVLVSYDGAVKVVDFGIARATSRSTKTHGGLKGKIAYMSPEQCRAKSTVDRRSDIFSIGTILYELTTGQLPFSGENEYATLNQIVNDEVPPPSTIVPDYPPALEKIVMRALARDPDERYSTAVMLQQHIEDFAHENRLRVSPLVLARVMSTLFPARLEEWDEAKTQGAFFVEQHVLRTLAESGKTADEAAALDDEEISDTAVAPPPITNELQRMASPPGRIPALRGRAPVGTPPAAAQAPPTPPSQMPRATPARAAAPPAPAAAARRQTPRPHPRASTSADEIQNQTGTLVSAGGIPGITDVVPIAIGAQMPGTLVSTQPTPDAVVQHHVRGHVDVTQRVRVPTEPAKRKPLIAIAAAVFVLAIVIVVASRGGASAPVESRAVERRTPHNPALTEILAAPPAKPPVEQAEPPSAVATPLDDKPVAAPVETAPTEAPKPQPVRLKIARPVAKPRPKLADAPRSVSTKPKIQTKSKIDPKETPWNADSPFLPVRADKR